MAFLEWLVWFIGFFILIGNYTSVITNNKTNIRTTRRFNGVIWCWLLREKMFWRRVENLKPNSQDNVSESV